VIATPLGNLGDITARAVEALGQADLVACEDTRRTRVLLSHLGLSRPTRSSHRFNEAARLDPLLASLREGRTIALVTDAGTPGVSDPGARLVEAARREGIRVEAIPGPSAPSAAISISGLEAAGFHFSGYPPSRSGARRRFLAGLRAMEAARAEADSRSEPWPLVLFEAPHRIEACLRDIREELGDREMVLVREMTKLHEEVIRGRVTEVAAALAGRTPRGEFTLVISGAGREAGEPLPADRLKEAYRRLLEEGVDGKEALRRLAKRTGQRRRDLYRALLEAEEPGGR
jgi:16S rRNA (cytidine1402-2'-O)-methyltransferase